MYENEIQIKNEKKFEKWKRGISLFLGPAIAILLFLIPLEGLNPSAHAMISIFALVLVWWIGEPIPLGLTALAIPFLLIVTGIAGPKEAFSQFAHPIIFLFLGSFIIAEGIRIHEVDKYFATKLMTFSGKDARSIALAAGGSAWFLSFWLSNTATTAMFLPLTYGIAKGVKERKIMCGILLFLAYSASIGGVTTPVGTPPNLITLGFWETLLNYRMDFFKWMMISIPVTVSMLIATYWIMRIFYIKEAKIEQTEKGKGLEFKSLSPAQKNLIIVIGLVIFFWIFPGIAGIFIKDEKLKKILSSRLDETIPAVGGALLLFLLPRDWKEMKFTLTPSILKEIEWNTILLFGGGLTLGEMLIKTGLGNFISENLFSFMGTPTLFKATFFFSVSGVILTEIMSNTAAVNLLLPLIIPFCKTHGISPLIPSLATCYACSLAFFLPISTPPNAIVYSSGYIKITEMMKAGLLCDIAGIIIINGWMMSLHYFRIL